jgi:hypothetical protein
MDMKKYITLLENNSKPKEVKAKPIQPKVEPQPQVHVSESYEPNPVVRKIVRNIMEKKNPEPPKQRNPVAKNANAAVGGGAAGKHKDRKKDAKQGVQKHKGQQLDEYFEKEKPTDGELLLLMKKYRLAKISGKPLGSVMRQSDIHKLIDAEKDGRIEALKYKDSIDERYDDEDDQEYTSKSDFKRRELEHELGHETRSGAVYIDGRYWKTFDTYNQAQNIARSLERKGKNAVARMLESKKPKKTAQEKLSAAVDKERKKNEPATRRAKQELDAAMPSKALAEGRVCPQCGSSKCSCPPGKCKCKPVAGFKPKMSEDKDPCWKNYKMVGTKKKGSKTVPNCVPKEGREQGVAEGGPFSYGKPPRKGSVAANAAQKRKEQDRKTPPIEPKDQMVGNAKVTKDTKESQLDELDRPSGKLYIIITADNAGAPHVFGDFGSFPQDVMHKVSKRGTRDKSGTKTKLKIDFLFDDFRTTIQHLRTIFRDLDFIGAEAAEFIIKSSALRSDQGEDVKHLKDYIESGDDRRMKMYQAPEDDEEEGEPTGGNILRIDPETGAARRVVGVKPQTQMGGHAVAQPTTFKYTLLKTELMPKLRDMGFKFDGNQIILRAEQRDKLKNMLGTQFQSVFGQKDTFKEGGPFSYGKKTPRKGSVADLAAKHRKEQDRKTSPIEPKDQMVGNAKVTKDTKEGLKQMLRKVDPTIKSRLRRKADDLDYEGDEVHQDLKSMGMEPHDAMTRNMDPEKYYRNADRYRRLTNKENVAEGGEKYKIKSIGSDVDKESGERRDYYISPSTGKKVYKDGVKKGDHENPKSGEHKPKVEGRFARAIMKEFGL